MNFSTWYSGRAGSRWMRTALAGDAGWGGTKAALEVVVAVKGVFGGVAGGGFRRVRASTGCGLFQRPAVVLHF